MTQAEVAPQDVELPHGMEFHDRLGLIVHTMVARQLPTHTVLKRPTRHFPTCTFDQMSGNTMLAMHLANIEVDVVKCDHRHLDETGALILAGRGFSEFRQADDAEPLRVEWEAGDYVVIPSNAWHRHVNVTDTDARQISFRNVRLMNSILHGGEAVYDAREGVYHSGARFLDRFADEPDYFTTRAQIAPGRVRTNFIKQAVAEPLPDDDPEYGHGVAIQSYWAGGQRTLDVAVAGIRAGGRMRPHRPLAEEAFYVLAGRGATDVWSEGGHARTIRWEAGDLVSPPLGAWRQHLAGDDTRLFMVRNVVIERALGLSDHTSAWQLDHALPDRLGALAAAGLADAVSR